MDITDRLELFEKWKKKVKIEKTGEHAPKSKVKLKKEVQALRGKPGNKEKMGELLFALRAKQGWKKGKGATGLGGKWKEKSKVEEMLDQFEKEQLKIAQQAAQMSPAMAMALGGMTPEEAQEILDTYKKTGKVKQ